MDNFTRLICRIILLLLPLGSFANAIIVKGTVKYSNGQPVVNKTITITLDSSNGAAACYQFKTVKTNPNGYYIDTISCNSSITKIKVSTENCDGKLLINYPDINTTSNYAESNFIICIPDTTAPSATCKAVLSSEKIQGRTFRFSSRNSTVPGGDSIVLRRWTFGDGSILEGKEISLLKEFKDTGVYNVCLLIKTQKGCESKICVTIIVRDSIIAPPVTCQAKFSYRIDGKKIILNSTSSFMSNDSIIRYGWVLGDGKIIDSAAKELVYQYAKTGKYQVCLYTRTAKGCESKYCTTIEITEPLSCTATYTFEKTGNRSYRFNSGRSLASSGDSIKQRIWVFGDGTAIEGNEINPLKTFKDTGTYTVCLKIKSAKGCEAMYCNTIVVKDSAITNPPLYCKAVFSFTKKEQAIQFNSLRSIAPQGDSIVSRTWYFGDSSAALTGNRKDPVYQYQKAGVYNVCLVIKTAKGCESRYCENITYTIPNNQCVVKFSDERLSQKKIKFNSSGSTAIAGDSIIERKWKFGDGTELGGNIVSPEKEYRQKGIYTVCLKIKTAAGCSSEVCKVFEIKDSTANESISQRIKILQINPNPVVSRFITTIWTKMGIEVEISIYDIYGTIKWKTKKGLLTGNNFIEIPAIELKTGPYFLRVSSAIGNDSRLFYKL
jgi:PKD repeat protein